MTGGRQRPQLQAIFEAAIDGYEHMDMDMDMDMIPNDGGFLYVVNLNQPSTLIAWLSR